MDVTKICQKQNIHYCSYVLFVFVFSWLEFKNTSNALEPFKDQQRSHMLQYGIGYKGLVHVIFTIKGKEYQLL
ncbi:MAG TPA: hypothetical protein VLA74_00990 [Nitrososphaeraceae archaeon]|nr:hypothetical protein [Nitrososphaeraceae archaeon]